MVKNKLMKKPLIEAILEIRWRLKEKEGRSRLIYDPKFKVFLGRAYEKFIKEYKHYEQLPTASMPDEISAYVIQHRFRKDRDIWPLVQLGLS